MTGYGRADYNDEKLNLTVEIKTVNNRIFDFNGKMPRPFIAYEDAIRKTVMKYVSRGRIDLFVNFKDKREKQNSAEVDLNVVRNYYQASKEVAQELGLPNDVTVSGILRFPDVLSDSAVTDVSEFQEIIIKTVETACEKLNEMRETEGKKLAVDMLSRLDTIQELRNKIIKRAPLVAEDYKNKLKTRIEEALKDVKYDETRLLNEVAFYTDRVNIDEELTRLGSHIEQFKTILSGQLPGKKLDFLMQEFNRETNTICSKSNDVEVTGYALSLKNEIEKIREQVQNLE